MRRVLSLWLPRFATDLWSLQQARSKPAARRSNTWRARAAPSPDLGSGTRDAPAAPGALALIRPEQGRLLLAAVNAGAAAAGLGPGMPLADARAILPELTCADEELDAVRRALAGLAEWCGRYTPWVAVDPAGPEPGGAAGLLLDITGCDHLFGGTAALIGDLRARLARRGFGARTAVADTPGAAWGLARFATAEARPSLVTPPGGLREALAPLPPAALRLPSECCELLARLGLTRIADLTALPRSTLEPRFGLVLAERLDQALGLAPEPISPRLPVPPLLVRRVFAEPVATAESIAQALERLLAGLCRQMEDAHRGARRLELTLYRVDNSLRRLTLGTSRPSRDPAHLMRLFSGQLERIDHGFGIEVMTLAAPLADPLSALQLALDGPGGEIGGEIGGATGAAAGKLAALVDRLRVRLGAGRVIALAPRESHLPERAARRVAPLEADPTAPSWRAWQTAASRPPRPLRLRRWPAPVEALALLPDHPPAQFRWNRLLHRVSRAEGPERISPEWWRIETGDAGKDDGEDGAAANAALRDYFRVEDEDGRRFWLYRQNGRWFLHGLFG